ncbi:MAG: carboxypeptidase-like regulatory domain-containing protein [Terracidiphilus sp.]
MGATLTARQLQQIRAPRGSLGYRIRRTGRRGVFSLLAFTAIAAVTGRAQQMVLTSDVPAAYSASIHGTVTSTDGSVYQGAHVELWLGGESAQPGEVGQTDDDGAYSFIHLPAGPFKLVVSSAGFTKQEVSGTLEPGQVLEAQTIVLPMASTSNEVIVSGGSQVEIAQAQLKLEEKQRVLGVLPNYYVSYDHNAEPLTTKQKYQLAWKTEIDPVTWAMTGAVAGFEQAHGTFSGYGQGSQGFAKRFGANYADGFVGTMLGGAALPAWFKQDPRYFYKGTGSFMSRAGYAIANAVICKGDNGHWQANYSGIIGGLAAGAISNLYYPASDRANVGLIFESAAIGTGEGAVQNLIQEFIVRKLTPRLPHFPSMGTP